MSGLYWVINAALVLAAIVASAMALRQAPDARWDVRAQQRQPVVAPREPKGAPSSAGWDAAAGGGAAQPVDAEALWRQTLFNPARTEDTTQAGDDEAAAPSRVDLDLQGILQVGEVAAAIIVQKQVRAPRARIPRVAGRPGPDAPAEAAADTTKTKHVYLLNETVGTTGYVVKAIHLDEVVLVRGDEERILKLQTDDADSVARRNAAADEAAKREEDGRKDDAKRAKDEPADSPQKIAAGGSATLPPPPPPPPPGAGVPGRNGVSATPAALSAEERIQRARELRERLLERRRNATPSQVTPPTAAPAEAQ